MGNRLLLSDEFPVPHRLGLVAAVGEGRIVCHHHGQPVDLALGYTNRESI